MNLPIKIKNYIENELNNEELKYVKKDSEEISKNYREKIRDGKSILSKERESIAYSISRMPATFGAISKSLEKTFEIYNPKIRSVADIGAGTGSASIAINELKDVDKIDCYEREDSMIEVGKKISQNYQNLNSKIIWNKLDITKNTINNSYDLVISAYMINELKEDQIEEVIKKMWDISKDLIIIVEPGTFQGYKNIMRSKDILVNLGGNIIAPCMSKNCKLPKDDWCNFYCRIERTKAHRTIKSGSLSFEDEKFMYIAITKNKINIDKENRIIRHPLIYNGYVKLKICKDEEIKEITVTRKEKDKFKIVKKSCHGDLF